MLINQETARRNRLTRLGILEEPMGYVDGHNLYEYVKSNPVTLLDPTGLTVTIGEVNGNPARPGRRIDVLDLAQGSFLEEYQADSDGDYIEDHQWGGTQADIERDWHQVGEDVLIDLGCGNWRVERTYDADGTVWAKADSLTISRDAIQSAHDLNRDISYVESLVNEFNRMSVAHEQMHLANYRDLYTPIDAVGEGPSQPAARDAAQADFETQLAERQAGFDRRKLEIDNNPDRDRGRTILNTIRDLLDPNS